MRGFFFTCLVLYIVYELIVGLSNALNAESNPASRAKPAPCR